MRAGMPLHQVRSRLELEGSCGAPVCVRWRAEKQLSRCKAFDDVHGAAAERALRKAHGWPGFVGGLFNSGSMDRTAKQPEAERQQCGTLAVPILCCAYVRACYVLCVACCVVYCEL